MFFKKGPKHEIFFWKNKKKRGFLFPDIISHNGSTRTLMEGRGRSRIKWGGAEVILQRAGVYINGNKGVKI